MRLSCVYAYAKRDAVAVCSGIRAGLSFAVLPRAARREAGAADTRETHTCSSAYTLNLTHQQHTFPTTRTLNQKKTSQKTEGGREQRGSGTLTR
eukprot:1450502-Rhodomonas_salina.1